MSFSKQFWDWANENPKKSMALQIFVFLCLWIFASKIDNKTQRISQIERQIDKINERLDKIEAFNE